MASPSWRPGRLRAPQWESSSPPPLLEEKPKTSRFSRRSTRAQSQARHESQRIELEVEEHIEERDRERRRSLLAAMFGHRTASQSSRTSRSSSDADAPQQTLVQRDKAFRLVRHGSDPLLNDGFYNTQVQVGNFVKMGWLTKQGHMWKSWKTRFFVLFSDGTFVYYKSKGRKKIKGCMQLNDGVVSIQHVDVRVAEKSYVFQIEKGFYRLLCYCCSQFEAELWVTALRSVRRVAPPCSEIDLTAAEEKAGSNAVTRLLNKIFITDKYLAKALEEFKVNEHDHSYASIHNFIVEIDDAVIDRHHLEFYQDPEIELLPGNELVRLIRRHVEDRVFIPLYAEAYSSLETSKLKERRSRLAQNLKVLKQKTQADFGIPDDLSSVCGWELAINMAKTLDCVSLPTHKFEVVLSIGKAIMELIAQYNGRRPLHVVKQSIEMAQIIESLINGGADIDATEKHGLTPLILNEVVDRLSDHIRHWTKCHGLIRLFIMILLYKKSEAQEADDLQERFHSIISHNFDIPTEKLELLVEEYITLYVEYFSLRGAGDYAVSYEVIPGAMTKLYCQGPATSTASTEPFPIHLHRYISPERWAEQCTLLTHAIFCKIPVRDFVSTGSKQHSIEFTCIKRWFQHAADCCASLHNHDTMAAILYALQSTAVQRLRKSIDCLSVASKQLMNNMQLLSDKGCREMNRLMRKTSNPSMPYIGLYLQGFVGLNELPVFDKEGLVNARRLRKMGELSMEILHRQSVSYALRHDEKVDKLLHVSMPYPSEESRYARSLELEPREADAIPLSDRGSCVVLDDDVDIENEVRESIGAEGTFGFRQWIRKQQVVHRNRSRSSLMAQYEWV
ncbi:Ankyrin repeat and death domain-containing protein 1B [Phytophthora boehmeriae]|uniref:Ankyrin repeat and death domain-containing protein 1B n=1 Tax=Phytophthora boehmeriae TaxID=109152 RepID=A0A8T1XD36_9STRA|nr:Ankyrin repeat and death domain-containing protein 1B [Phytophthora boehmeriae]